jgi:hypothetical protein
VGPPISVNDNGEFVAELVDGPGAYSIVAAGEGGFGAGGFYARPLAELDAMRPHDREFFVSTELAQVVAGGAENSSANTLSFPLVSNDVLRSQLPAIGIGAGAAQVASDNRDEMDSEAQDFPLATPGRNVAGGFAHDGMAAGSGRGRGLGALLLGSGVVAAIAISSDGDQRRAASPFVP